MKGFPKVWPTPNGELYKIEKKWPNMTPLAHAFGQDTKKFHTCIWKNEYGAARVFGMSLGHHNETMRSDVYLDVLTRGLLWTVNRLESDGSPAAGYAVSQPAASERKVWAADYSKRKLVLMDSDYQVLRETPIRNIHDLHVLKNGNLLTQTDWDKVIEFEDRAGKLEAIWQYNAKANGNEGRQVEIHAFQRLDNGLTMIVESGPARILEVNRKGEIVKNIPLLVKNPHPHRDTRLARKLANGHYLVAHEGDACVREYGASGNVVWEYEVGSSVYSAIRLRNGNTLIGTGNGHSVIEVNRQGKTVWSVEQNDLPGVRLEWVTNVAELPNGNILIGNCHAGPANPQIIEVDREKTIVWSFKDFEHLGNALPISEVVGFRGTVTR